MTSIRIHLTADNYRTLVSGQSLVFEEREAIKTRRFSFGPSKDHRVELILEDIGWEQMASIIEVARADQAKRKS